MGARRGDELTEALCFNRYEVASDSTTAIKSTNFAEEMGCNEFERPSSRGVFCADQIKSLQGTRWMSRSQG